MTDAWPKYPLKRVAGHGGQYSLECTYRTGVLVCHVMPFKNKNGFVSVRAVHPFAVEFSVPEQLAYAMDKKRRALVGHDGMTYVRQIAKTREIGPADTVWTLAVPPPAVAVATPVAASSAAVAVTATAAPVAEMVDAPAVSRELPRKLTVVNAGGRVLVWRGAAPRGAAECAHRAPTDLLARINSAVHGAATDVATDARLYQVDVNGDLAATLRPSEMPMFLAIAMEAFWSQGARGHSAEVVGVRAESAVVGGADVRPNSSVVSDAFAGRSKMLPS